ncbi:hypothetical protein IEO21_04175 [Rhodonia placenta]|uniref:Aminoacyl-transfer RNA synthetases class-II family profile domain-containing protein n=1 Tax=Rhodonia placenta TaxID=104341 RepID=A0A8H7P4P3_9APHY|nr:hypothetical protein IEO21_04175 [Postia placenta]
MHHVAKTSASGICRVLPKCLLRLDTVRPTSRTQRCFTNGVSGSTQHLRLDQEAHCAPYPKRTHTCRTLSSADVDVSVTMHGWLLPERKVNKKLSFFSLRDPYGTVQLVVSGNSDPMALSKMRDVPPESTVLVQGVVKMRAKGQQRPYPGGDIEVVVSSFTLLNPADRNLPFVPSDTENLANEQLRLRYRYLDLRRNELSANIRKRSDVAHIVRTVFHERDFTEVETPMLLKSTPEGAREFLVPTRVIAPATNSRATQSPMTPLFYALPQSPQQPKQLLIASGAVDRYYQLARCFRDEDGRKDRQPEFTQVDLEMAWVSWGELEANVASPQEQPILTAEADGSAPLSTRDSWRIGGHEVRDVVEAVVRRIWAEIEKVELPFQFPVMTYNSAMTRFGSDKPDTRFGLEVVDVTSHLPAATQETFAVHGEAIDALIVREDSSADHPFLRAAPFSSALNMQGGGVLWLSKRPRRPEGGSTALGRLRLQLASRAQALGDLTLPSYPHFLWVTEFPLFTRADPDKDFLAHGRWSSSHHPFTAPMWQDIGKMYKGKIAEIRGQHYDLVLNGVEIGGGSVRVHDADMQDYIFSKILQLDEQEKASFDHLLHALRCGAPPHGGFAYGFDRLMAILCKTESIRDVIAFPKTGAGTDLLFKSPAPASKDVLAQYGIRAQ